MRSSVALRVPFKQHVVRYAPGEVDEDFKMRDGMAATALPSTCNKIGVAKGIEKLQGEGFDVGIRTYQMGLHLAGVEGKVGEMEDVLRMMKREGVVMTTECYNALIEVCIAMQGHAIAFRVRDVMAKWDVQPDSATFTLLLKSLSKVAQDAIRAGDEPTRAEALSRGTKIITVMQDRGVYVTRNHITLLMKMGTVQDAVEIMRKAESTGMIPDKILYGVLCSVQASFGDVTGVLNTIREVRRRTLEPDDIMWGSAFEACKLNSGLRDILKVLSEMNSAQRKLSTSQLTVILQCMTPHIANSNPHALRVSRLIFTYLSAHHLLTTRITSRMASTYAALGPPGRPLLEAFVRRHSTFPGYEELAGRGLGSRFHRAIGRAPTIPLPPESDFLTEHKKRGAKTPVNKPTDYATWTPKREQK
eukprot:TRINITY_DN28875_c0_g1_i1.p1 TRINITY_DN28875_c0_g1~~TRINITY_DN28875_c0_g1_i1.p1  ORF type:complete len:417 (+),score=33.46 TRINITY_DN28875_c0_g1_i1:87-1337(+)